MIKNGKVKFRAKIFSRIIFFAGIAALVLLCSALSKEYYREYQIQKEINSLQEDINSFKKDNYKLSQLLEYYNTDEYKEADIRKRFTLGKEGEKLAVIELQTDDLASSNAGSETETIGENLPNYIKWWNYFFASRK